MVQSLRVSVLLSIACVSAILVTGCSSDETANRAAAAAETTESAPEVTASETVPLDTPSAEPVSSAPQGEPWVVSLGDSYISGEAGRWAGNQTWSTNAVDALGAKAYHDSGTGETIERCHRSESALIHIGDAKSLNLACSGAITSTKITSEGWFKPGIDFYDRAEGKGQALMLEEFAAENRVGLVALSIGGNDFKFAPVMAECVKAYLEPAVFGAYCSKSAIAADTLSESNISKVRGDITGAMLNVAKAMENAGYQDSEWTLGVQLYPSPIAEASNNRYKESGYDRQLKGGCGFRDEDGDWAIKTFLPRLNQTVAEALANAIQERPTLQAVTVDTSNAFAGRALCDKSVNRVRDNGGAMSWKDADAVDKSEWVMEVNMVNPRDTFGQESAHPNYWGQLALRSCWRQAWNGGSVRGGVCERDGTGLNAQGEPNMVLR